MAFTSLRFLFLALSLFATPLAASADNASPIVKVLQLVSDLQAKILKEGDGAQKSYEEFSEWCEERSKTLSHEIKTGKAEAEELKAAIAKEVSTTGSLETKVEKLAGELSTDEADLKAATEIREKEHESFLAEEKELSETTEIVRRAIGIIEREMKGGASMLQLQGARSVVQALSVLVTASSLSSSDAQRLTALVQSSSEETDVGAPAGAVYESHSGGILDTLTDLLEKSEEQLDAARQKETKDLHAFEMLEQSLKDEIKYGQKELAEAKQGISAAGEKKASLEGDLGVTSKDLAGDTTALGDLHHECMTKAEEFEAETKSRGEELAALAKAKEVIQENVGGAEDLSYGLNQVPSFLLVARASSGITSRVGLAQFEATRIIRDLARKQGSSELAQLAVRMGSTMSLSSKLGEDPFGKIKGLIQDMLEKLEKEAEADATHKAFCDKELAESNEKKADKTEEIEKLSTQIDKMSARSSQLKEEIADLEKALSELASSQAEMDKIRAEEKKTFAGNKADMEQGLEGVKMALKILREYYAKEDKSHVAAEGAGGGIIGLLEVVESDFTKGLAEMTATEDSAQAAYEEETKENEIEKTTKQQDVKYKTKESTELDKTVAETNSDRKGVQEELDAVLTYLKKIEETCIAKAETFEERKARFEAELAGLKEALRVLEEETALVQRGSARKTLRGVRVHAALA